MARWVEQKARCDQCGQEVTLPNGDGVSKPLPWPWRTITLAGWCAQFVACGDECETKFRARYERPEASPPPSLSGMTSVPTPVPSTPPPQYNEDEDTQPSIRLPVSDKEDEDGQ
ncbi:MAG: hypothetical protein ACWGQW_00625 [bacterium]